MAILLRYIRWPLCPDVMLATGAYFKARLTMIVRFLRIAHMSRKSCLGHVAWCFSGYGTLTMCMVHCAPVPIE
ncbi:hypothetical protein CH75_16920 [Dyella jiangningensis]|nr:hypothetical protein CH75_16920 [Dyella jiangningensis]